MKKIKTVAGAAGILAMAFCGTTVQASGSSDLAVGKYCAVKLFAAVRGKNPQKLFAMSKQLVDLNHVMRAAAAINGDTLTPQKKVAYTKGMNDFAKHMLPQLAAKLHTVPQITSVTARGNALTISDGSDMQLVVNKNSCRIIDAESAMMGTLTGNVAKFIKDNNFS